MKLWRSLLFPLYPASLMFVGITAVLLAVVEATAPFPLIKIIPNFFLLSWLFKYAYHMLEYAADGRTAPPVLDSEMLGPFEQRPMVQMIVCAIALWIAVTLAGIAGLILAILVITLLPASIAVQAIERSALKAVNPLILWRFVRGLGPYYALILVAAGLCSLALWALLSGPRRGFVDYALSELLFLSVFGLIGGCCFLRRLEIGFEPRSSPERRVELLQQDDARQRAAVLDEVYGLVRVRRSSHAAQRLEQWLADRSPEQVAADGTAAVTAALTWDSALGKATVVQTVVTHLMRRGSGQEALERVEQALRSLPTFSLDSEPDAVMLADLARRLGQTRFAETMLGNFQAAHSKRPAPSVQSKADS